MRETFTFDDVLIEPVFSTISSRKEVDTSQEFLGLNLKFPLLNANMDTIASSNMAVSLANFGSLGTLHRFKDINASLKEFDEVQDRIFNSSLETCLIPIVSIGIGSNELERAMALNRVGAKRFLIDVAHGAAQHVVDMYDALRSKLTDDSYIVVGNFATESSIRAFVYHSKSVRNPDAFKVGIGGGSVCSTRIVTGCGTPTLSSVLDCVNSGYPIIADGGIRNSGDIAKALAAGATTVMVGNLLAGTDETPGEPVYKTGYFPPSEKSITHKKYRGSASLESYEVQCKVSNHRAPEGESILVPYKGPVVNVLNLLKAGVQSAMSYVGASNLKEFEENAEFIQVSHNGALESLPHGKNTNT